MKKIINGKRYDTATATLIHHWDNGIFPNDFRFREKELYRTKKGKWFLLHQGGAMTDMQVRCGSNSFSGSSELELISEFEAFEFLQNHEGEKAAEKYFSNLIEDA